MESHDKSERTPQGIEPTASPRISFSGDFTNGTIFISGVHDSERENTHVMESERASDADFEFLSGNSSMKMVTADEVFFEGRVLPFWKAQQMEKLNKINFKPKEEKKTSEEGTDVSWFVDDDPSPRPPKCTVLWKELLRLKKHHPPSSSSSPASLVHLYSKDGEKGDAGGSCEREKHVKRIKKGLERTRSASVRIRPVVHVPICTQGKNNSVPVFFAMKKE